MIEKYNIESVARDYLIAFSNMEPYRVRKGSQDQYLEIDTSIFIY